MNKNSTLRWLSLLLVLAMLVGCAKPTPTPVPAKPTAVPAKPTAAPAPEEREKVILEALNILEAALPLDHPYTLNTLRGLRRLYAEDAMNVPEKLADVESRIAAKEKTDAPSTP